MWDDVIGEPEGLRSTQCAWSCSYKCFRGTRNCCYILLVSACLIMPQCKSDNNELKSSDSRQSYLDLALPSSRPSTLPALPFRYLSRIYPTPDLIDETKISWPATGSTLKLKTLFLAYLVFGSLPSHLENKLRICKELSECRNNCMVRKINLSCPFWRNPVIMYVSLLLLAAVLVQRPAGCTSRRWRCATSVCRTARKTRTSW